MAADPGERHDMVSGVSAEASCAQFHKALPRKRLAPSKLSTGTSCHAARSSLGPAQCGSFGWMTGLTGSFPVGLSKRVQEGLRELAGRVALLQFGSQHGLERGDGMRS